MVIVGVIPNASKNGLIKMKEYILMINANLYYFRICEIRRKENR